MPKLLGIHFRGCTFQSILGSMPQGPPRKEGLVALHGTQPPTIYNQPLTLNVIEGSGDMSSSRCMLQLSPNEVLERISHENTQTNGRQ